VTSTKITVQNPTFFASVKKLLIFRAVLVKRHDPELMLQQRQIIANSNFAINLTILPDIQNESNPTNIKFLTYHGLAFIHGITDQYSVGAERSHIADPDVEGLKQKRRHNLNFPPFLTNNNRDENSPSSLNGAV
jgi:hypothetical protein